MPTPRKLKGKEDDIIAALMSGESVANVAQSHEVTIQSIYALLKRYKLRIVHSVKRVSSPRKGKSVNAEESKGA